MIEEYEFPLYEDFAIALRRVIGEGTRLGVIEVIRSILSDREAEEKTRTLFRSGLITNASVSKILQKIAGIEFNSEDNSTFVISRRFDPSTKKMKWGIERVSSENA